MNIIRYPEEHSWEELLKRPALDHFSLEEQVNSIVREVADRGDAAVRDYTRKFDGVELDTLEVGQKAIAAAADRPLEQLDPVERAVLWIGVAELGARPDVPAKVAINEAVELAKEFGASDSHRYINAILDSVASGRS